MLTIMVMMYVLVGAAITLIVLTSCQETLDSMDELSKLWLVIRWVLGWPYKLYMAFHEGVLVRC